MSGTMPLILKCFAISMGSGENAGYVNIVGFAVDAVPGLMRPQVITCPKSHCVNSSPLFDHLYRVLSHGLLSGRFESLFVIVKKGPRIPGVKDPRVINEIWHYFIIIVITIQRLGIVANIQASGL